MKKLLLVATLSIAVAAVIKRVTDISENRKNVIRISGKTFEDIKNGY